MRGIVAVVLLSPVMCPAPVAAQLNSGRLRGKIRDANGSPAGHRAVFLEGAAGAIWQLGTDARGEFSAVLPYGLYRLHLADPGEAGVVAIHPLRVAVCELRLPSPWNCITIGLPRNGPVYPSSYSLSGELLHYDPGLVAEPLDTSGLGGTALPRVSDRSFSWTATRFRFQGMDATDPYQPGRPVVVPDVQAAGEFVVRNPPEVDLYVRAVPFAWHGALASDNTGSLLAADNLPAPGERGYVLRPAAFTRYTRDHLEVGGPVERRIDLFLSGTGQWAGQTVPLAPARNDLSTRLLFGNARGLVRTGRNSRLDAQFSGSRIDRSGWSLPAGIEALAGLRMSPPLLPSAALSEVDHFDFVQTGWTRQVGASGLLELRYGYSTAHLDTQPSADFGPGAQARTDMSGGATAGPPFLSNLAVRTRHGMEFAIEPGEFRQGHARHRVTAGAGWQLANARNRFQAPSGGNLITAGGVPAAVLELNTPLDSRTRVVAASIYGEDDMAFTRWLSLRAGFRAEFSRGSLISWNGLAPQVGISLAPPGLERRLTLRAAFSRSLEPLAGRYLDFGNPNSLGGLEYRYQDSGVGPLLSRFGGPYSAIDPHLKRPYADEIQVGAEASLPYRIAARLQLFRRDEKDRIAALDTGVPPRAFHPVAIIDPLTGQALTVYAQDPATLGQDRFLLTNPPHLRFRNSGVLAGVATSGRRVTLRASFLAEKSYGPTNPGNAVWQNDPGVIGALLGDPNTLVNAAGRSFFDRAYVGKVEADTVLPAVLRRVEIGSVATYTDGLVFGRQLLVTGLAQGPFLVDATVRGSPEGGHRTQYFLDWDLRLSRGFQAGPGRLTLRADVFNLLNGGNKTREYPYTNPLFDRRLALAFQPARFFRFGFQYQY